MPQGLTNYTEGRVLDLIFGAAAFPAPATLYFGLHTGATAPDLEAATGIVEPTVGAYARVAITNNATNFPAATQNGANEAQKSNAGAITFPQATADWGTATHWFVADAATVGNAIAIGALTTPKAINLNDTASFAGGAIVITMD